MKKQTYAFINEDGIKVTKRITIAHAVLKTADTRYVYEGDVYECAYWLVAKCTALSDKSKIRYEDIVFKLVTFSEENGSLIDLTDRVDVVINKCMKHRKGVK